MDKIRKQPVDWGSIYKDAPKNVWEQHPHEYSVLATYLAPAGNATDLGCGEGYDAMLFADKGYKTVAIDMSDIALQGLHERTVGRQVDLQICTGDVASIQLTRPQSLIASYGVLHFLGARFKEQIEHFKQMTIKDGVHAIYTFGNQGDFYDIGKQTYWFPGADELLSMYDSWDVKKIEEKNIEMLIQGDNGETLHNNLIKILAQKI